MTDNSNKNDNNINKEIPKEQQNIIMKNLIKENEIISKVIKGKITKDEALNKLLHILNEQRDFIENISEEHFILEKSVSRLNTSIDLLKTKLKVTHDELDITKIINANKIQFKPNEAISFSKLNNKNKIIMNNTFNNHKKIKTQIKINKTPNYNIDYDRLLQMSISDFKKKKLKPINKKNK